MSHTVYKRKIHVHREANRLDPEGTRWVYAWSTHAYPTCKAAVAAAEVKCPGVRFTARFAKD